MNTKSRAPLSMGAILMGLLATSTMALAGETYNTGGPDKRAQQIFTQPDQQMAIQLASMSSCGQSSCCVPNGCCDVSCNAPSPCCGDALACGEGCGGCGEGCGAGLFSDDSCGDISIGGWWQSGYHNGVTPAAANRNDGMAFNNHPHRINLHQAWLYAEKVADGSNGMDWGFRMDLMYGVDASDTQSFGNRPGRWDFGGDFGHGAGYGWAIPQLYAEVASGDWNFKAGHFFTLIGYEVVTAPDNFFYSHSLTMYNSEPFTHTGVLATYAFSDATTLYTGWTAGWDTGFDRVNGGSNFLGGFSRTVSDDVTFTYISTYGNFGARQNGELGYSHSIVVDVELMEDLNWVVQSDLVRVGTDDDVGINQYLITALNEIWSAGIRTEWWKNDGASQYAVTYGLNIKPNASLTIRPEVRHDFHMPSPNTTETTFGMDAILTF